LSLEFDLYCELKPNVCCIEGSVKQAGTVMANSRTILELLLKCVVAVAGPQLYVRKLVEVIYNQTYMLLKHKNCTSDCIMKNVFFDNGRHFIYKHKL